MSNKNWKTKGLKSDKCAPVNTIYISNDDHSVILMNMKNKKINDTELIYSLTRNPLTDAIVTKKMILSAISNKRIELFIWLFTNENVKKFKNELQFDEKQKMDIIHFYSTSDKEYADILTNINEFFETPDWCEDFW